MKSFTKTFAIAVLFIFIGAKAHSQILPVSLEIRAGSNLSTMNIKGYDTNARGGLNAGIIGELSIPFTGVFLQTGLLYSGQGATKKDPVLGNTTINANYLKIPVLAGFRVRAIPTFSIRFFAGPYFASGVGGRTTNPDGSRMGTFSADGLQRFDSGIMVGVSGQLLKFTLNLGYEYGWTDISRSDIRINNQNSFITIGYRIF